MEGSLVGLVWFLLVTFGATHVVTRGLLFEPLRHKARRWPLPFNWNLMLECSTCVGFWVGILTAAAFRFTTIYTPRPAGLADYIVCGIAGSAVCALLQTPLDLLWTRRFADDEAEGPPDT